MSSEQDRLRYNRAGRWGYEPFAMFGQSADVDAGAFQSLGIGDDTTLALPAAAGALAVASTSANDTSAGTGARTARVFGLDANYAEITEDFTLNGQTKVTGAEEFLRINSVQVLTVGSGGENAGAIWVGPTGATFTSGVPDTKNYYVNVGFNISTVGQWTVPASQSLYLEAIEVNAQASANQIVTIRLETQVVADGLFLVQRELLLADRGLHQQDSLRIGEKTDVRFRAKGSANDAELSVVALFQRCTNTASSNA